MAMAKRLKGMGQAKYQTDGDPRTSGPGFGLTVHPTALELPLRWRKPRLVFVNSMSDLFHAKVPDRFLAQVFAVMHDAEQHTFQILTKRHGRMRSLLNSDRFHDLVVGELAALRAPWQNYQNPNLRWPLPNVWLGVSVEDQQRAELRIPALLDTPAAVRFLSCEPLLAAVDLSKWLLYVCPQCFRRAPWTDGLSIAAGDHTDEYWCQACGAEVTLESCEPPPLHWVIAGGESGVGARSVDPEWIRKVRDQCVAGGVPFLFKQWGGRTPKAGGRVLDGRTWDEFPTNETELQR
jgi:protein gp37